MKKFLLYLILFFGLFSALGTAKPSHPLTKQQIDQLFQIHKTGKKINSTALPQPFCSLLVQPLITPAIEKYYQRTAVIQTIYSTRNHVHGTYSRAILMLIDRNKTRNNPLLAQAKNESQVVELASITMNFNALPQKIIEGVLKTNIPFGKLLKTNNITVTTTDRRYFSVTCTQALSALTHCRLNHQLYGRTNTLVNATSQVWLAQVVEILID